MSIKYSEPFKEQAVEKAHKRTKGTTAKDIAESLGIDPSTLRNWIVQSTNNALSSPTTMTKEKRPQDWSLEDRLNIVIKCASLDEGAISELCREKGIYPHHVQQWKQDFVTGPAANNQSTSSSEMKGLKVENKGLRKELRRKDKALAETAALLVLQKKVSAIWGSEEDN
jgi:transposase